MLGVSGTPVLDARGKVQRSGRSADTIKIKSEVESLMEIWRICHQDLIDGLHSRLGLIN